MDEQDRYDFYGSDNQRISDQLERDYSREPKRRVTTLIGKITCHTDHAQLKADPELWAELATLGEQQTWDDDGADAVLVLKNCPECFSTLARLK